VKVRVAKIEVQIFCLGMGRTPARFRISIKDNKTGKVLKVELIDRV
jgi:hypothetical protein